MADSTSVDLTGDPYKGMPRPMEYYERALWEIAVCGGNVSQAHRNLTDNADEGDEPYSAFMMRTWVRGRLRNRYHQICTGRARELEELSAQQSMELALRLAEAEQDALRQTMAGIASADAVGASQILRNLTQSKAMQIDKSLTLRGRGDAHVQARPLEEIAAALVRLGVASVEGTAEEIPVEQITPPRREPGASPS